MPGKFPACFGKGDQMLEIIKSRCGIPEDIDTYDIDIQVYINDCLADMKASGVPERLLNLNGTDPQVTTAVTLYVKAYLGDDRSDTETYLKLYRQKVYRLTMEDE